MKYKIGDIVKLKYNTDKSFYLIMSSNKFSEYYNTYSFSSGWIENILLEEIKEKVC